MANLIIDFLKASFRQVLNFKNLGMAAYQFSNTSQASNLVL
jgi:hypothetical protein